MLGWAAASAVSDRCVYAGVVEHSVYVDPAVQSRGIGRALLAGLATSTEAAGIWTIQSGIFPENTASLRLHEKAGFRIVGIRQRVGKMTYGPLARSMARRDHDRTPQHHHRSRLASVTTRSRRLDTSATASKKGADMTVQVGYDFSLGDKVAVVTGGASESVRRSSMRTPPKAPPWSYSTRPLEAAQRKVNADSAAAASRLRRNDRATPSSMRSAR